MNRIFLSSLVFFLGAVCLLSEIQYAGVVLTAILVGTAAIFGLIAYCTRPKEVKEIQRDLGKATGYAVRSVNKDLNSFTKTLEKKEVLSLADPKLAELSASELIKQKLAEYRAMQASASQSDEIQK